MKKYPLITVGVPTYNRPKLLPRALDALALQTYSNLEIIVSDNHTEGDPVAEIINKYKSKFINLSYFRQSNNIGSIPNFLFLLEKARGDYFMWLTDDDEISPSYVQDLFELLQNTPDATSAMGKWEAITNLTSRVSLVPKVYPQPSALHRLASFYWRADDAFFHGLHRTNAIRKCTYHAFWGPNKEVALDWAYVFVLDLLSLGKVVKSETTNAVLINHMGNEKFYFQHQGKRLTHTLILNALRRINVHVLYNYKIGKKYGVLAAALFCLLSFIVLIREFSASLGWLARAVAAKIWRIAFK
jgi:glycosyltransferase involved in cell wall biosynthesis